MQRPWADTHFPVAAFSIAFQAKVALWEGSAPGVGHEYQNILAGNTGTNDSGNYGTFWQIYADINGSAGDDDPGTIRLYIHATGKKYTLFDVNKYNGWAMLGIRWAGPGNPLKAFFIRDGSSTIEEVVLSDFAQLQQVYVFAYVHPEEAPNQVYGCSLGIFDGYASNAKLIEQSNSEVPVSDTGLTAVSWYPMEDVATAHVDVIHGFNFSRFENGTTVKDSP